MLAAGARRFASCLGGRGAAPFGVGLSNSLVPSGLRSMCEKGTGDSKGKEGEGAAAGGEAAPAGGAAAGTAQRVPRTMAFSKSGGGWNQGSLAARSASLRPQAPMGGSRDWAQRPEGGVPEPVEYDKELLKKLGISHVPAWRIALILRDEDTTLEDMAQLVSLLAFLHGIPPPPPLPPPAPADLIASPVCASAPLAVVERADGITVRRLSRSSTSALTRRTMTTMAMTHHHGGAAEAGHRPTRMWNQSTIPTCGARTRSRSCSRAADFSPARCTSLTNCRPRQRWTGARSETRSLPRAAR